MVKLNITLVTLHKLDSDCLVISPKHRIFWVQIKTLGIFCLVSNLHLFTIHELLKVFSTINLWDILSFLFETSRSGLYIESLHSEVSNVRWNIYWIGTDDGWKNRTGVNTAMLSCLCYTEVTKLSSLYYTEMTSWKFVSSVWYRDDTVLISVVYRDGEVVTSV